MAGPNPSLLTPEEAAAVLRIGRTRLYAFLADGTIPSVQIGHSRRVAVRALEDYVRRLHERRDHEASPSVTAQGHDLVRRAPHVGTPDAELLPLPFPVDLEEQ